MKKEIEDVIESTINRTMRDFNEDNLYSQYIEFHEEATCDLNEYIQLFITIKKKHIDIGDVSSKYDFLEKNLSLSANTVYNDLREFLSEYKYKITTRKLIKYRLIKSKSHDKENIAKVISYLDNCFLKD